MEPSPPVTALTWETADGLELSRSFSDNVKYNAPVEISQKVICYGWDENQEKTPLEFSTLIVHGT